jgi:23S rRNA G2445 N2-methylase RlmL
MDPSDRKARFYARTMHTPDDPARAALRSALREMSRALIPLHRGLIEATKSDYSFAYSPIDTPAELLRLVQADPFFEWLKPVTTLIVDIDEIVRTDFQNSDVKAIVERAERMFGGDAENKFSSRYVPILQRDVDVAIFHADVRGKIQNLKSKI